MFCHCRNLKIIWLITIYIDHITILIRRLKMLNRKDYYAIYIETDERGGREVDYFETFEEAMDNRMKYANWYRPNGDVWIRHYDKTGAHCIEEWHIDYDGSTIRRYGWSGYKEV
jgi:hypothetical protein